MRVYDYVFPLCGDVFCDVARKRVERYIARSQFDAGNGVCERVRFAVDTDVRFLAVCRALT